MSRYHKKNQIEIRCVSLYRLKHRENSGCTALWPENGNQPTPTSDLIDDGLVEGWVAGRQVLQVLENFNQLVGTRLESLLERHAARLCLVQGLTEIKRNERDGIDGQGLTH